MVNTFRAVTKLLEDLVFFVVDIPNNGQDVLEIMVNKHNRERQKVMREQNILKQVIKGKTVQHVLCLSVFVKRKFKKLTRSFDFTSYNLILAFRSSSCCRLRSPTVGTGPCCAWRSWETSATPPSDTSAACATGSYATRSRTTGRTR